jgi:hypothetical protein
MNKDLFLVLLIILGKLVDMGISWRPAQGLVPGLGEGNPVVAGAITRYGVGGAFFSLTLISLGFVAAFCGVCWVEEAWAEHRQEGDLIQRIKVTRTLGLVILAALALLPVLVNVFVICTV